MPGLPGYQLGKLIALAGVALVTAGLLLMAGSRLGFFGLGRLPGDIAYRGKHVSVYFPIVTCIVLSAVITFILWLISHFRRP